MKTYGTAAVAMFAGTCIGAVTIHGLYAQTTPPVYYIAEIEPNNMETYMTTYAPRAQAVLKAAGGRTVASGRATAIEGEAPKPRVVVIQWDSIEQVRAWRNSPAFKGLMPERDELAKFRAFAIEGCVPTYRSECWWR